MKGNPVLLHTTAPPAHLYGRSAVWHILTWRLRWESLKKALEQPGSSQVYFLWETR